MDHDAVVRQKMTERYLLNELDSDARDQFEEHFFDCLECAQDVRLGALFVEQTKVVLAEQAEPAMAAAAPKPAIPRYTGLAALFRPALAVPVFALLLAVLAYQNLVTYPQLQQAANHPQVLPWTAVNVGTYGANEATITTAPGKGFLLFVRIPPEGGFASYSADLVNPTGKVEWSLTIPAGTSQDQYPVAVPGANRAPGTYTLVVRGTTTTGLQKDIGRTSFDLKIQN